MSDEITITLSRADAEALKLLVLRYAKSLGQHFHPLCESINAALAAPAEGPSSLQKMQKTQAAPAEGPERAATGETLDDATFEQLLDDFERLSLAMARFPNETFERYAERTNAIMDRSDEIGRAAGEGPERAAGETAPLPTTPIAHGWDWKRLKENNQ